MIANIKTWLVAKQNVSHWVLALGILILFIASCGIGAATAGSKSSSTSRTPNIIATTAVHKTATAQPTATPKPLAWVTVEHITGNQNQTTPTYHLKDGERIMWSVSASNGYGYFAIVGNNDSTGFPASIANTTIPPNQNGIYNVHGDTSMYLEITSSGDSYDIQIQAYQ